MEMTVHQRGKDTGLKKQKCTFNFFCHQLLLFHETFNDTAMNSQACVLWAKRNPVGRTVVSLINNQSSPFSCGFITVPWCISEKNCHPVHHKIYQFSWYSSDPTPPSSITCNYICIIHVLKKIFTVLFQNLKF